MGGNVAAYFCTPDLEVVHAIAGPVAPHVFLREARWAIDLASRFAEKDAEELPSFVAERHARDTEMDMLQVANWNNTSRTRDDAGSLLVRWKLAEAGLPPLVEISRYVFEEVLGERMTDEPIRYESLGLRNCRSASRR